MTAVREQQDLYFERFAALEKKRGAREPSWLSAIRRTALDRFGELGFPTTHHEEWRFTNVAPIARSLFRPLPALSDRSSRLSDFTPSWAAGCHTLVFINGRFTEGLSSIGRLPEGVRAGSLAAALKSDTPALEAHLARHAGYQDHAFVSLNTALFEDGAFVEILPNTVVEGPIALVFVNQPGDEPGVTHPRSLVLVGTGSQASFIEVHVAIPSTDGHGDSPYFTNAVTELVVLDNAIATYTRVQDESASAYHIGILQVEQGRSSNVTTHSIALGGRLDREEVRAVLNGEGAEAHLYGLYVLGGHQHVDNHTLIDHAKPHCSSREVYKGVLDGQAAGVFNGKIVVRQDAQKTDSKQSNKNLLLSADAVINTKPQLEIWADDVRCTHGATIGHIDAEAVFYLRSRGIGLEEARALLIRAFANDILDRIKFEPLRASLRDTLSARLRQPRTAANHHPRMSALEEAG